MDRTWEVFPELPRIESDILKYLPACMQIIAAGGTVVKGLGKRTGRRKYLRVLPHQSDCMSWLRTVAPNIHPNVDGEVAYAAPINGLAVGYIQV